MEARAVLFSLTLVFILSSSGVHSTTFTITNNCPYTIWPATLTGVGSQLPTSGFELKTKTSQTLNAPVPWSGRVWARTECLYESGGGKFSCATADCASGQVSCIGSGGIPPASLIEFTLSANNNQPDFYDISLVDGFNLPVSVSPQGGSGICASPNCSANLNAVCPSELAVKGLDGSVIACKSACVAFNTPEYCCSGNHSSPNTCSPSTYSALFKNQCPQAYSYAYDDGSSLFTCSGVANYVITFCP